MKQNNTPAMLILAVAAVCALDGAAICYAILLLTADVPQLSTATLNASTAPGLLALSVICLVMMAFILVQEYKKAAENALAFIDRGPARHYTVLPMPGEYAAGGKSATIQNLPGWVARDKNKDLHFFNTPAAPVRMAEHFAPHGAVMSYNLPQEAYPQLDWLDGAMPANLTINVTLR